jgi:malonyl CoA-acyl carrier protein transacylase
MEALLAATGAPDRALEVGPGNVLSGLMKRIARDLPAASTGDADSLAKAIETYGGRKEGPDG